MQGNGNDFRTLSRKLYFLLLPTASMRTRYIRKHKDMFRHIGEKVFWQPRNFPAEPALISIGNNVGIAANVTFITHDVISQMLNRKLDTKEFARNSGCIEIGDNVSIGAGVMILPDVRIGSNVIIGAGAVVTKDIPDGSVAAGVPCRVVGSLDRFIEKRKNVKVVELEQKWEEFHAKRQ